MRILIGYILDSLVGSKNCRNALSIPGLGILVGQEDDEATGFDCVYLNRKQLKILRKEIDKEIGRAKVTELE